MTKKFGFIKMNIQEFEVWISSIRIARTVLTIQHHHTFNPSYSLFSRSNHYELQQAMKNFHINYNGWAAIGQHFTTFPDGSVLTGRSLEISPACITGQNANAICIEHLGNFDAGKDVMTIAQRETIIRMTARLCNRFNLQVNTNTIVYHHWFDLNTGQRNNGTRNNKSCPGTAFFGGNKLHNCITNFLPLISKHTPVQAPNNNLLKYALVTAAALNIRSKPDAASPKVIDRKAASFGAVVRVYQEQNGFYKISNTQQHWIMAKYTVKVRRATVKAETLNVRSGPGKSFDKVGSYSKGQELFIVKEENGWCRAAMDDKWISKDFLIFTE